MAKGGHARSGPRPDPNSLNSQRKGLSYGTLPAEGYQGEPPEWPLPASTPRELEVWREVWRTPQAVAWSVQPWRHHPVALWVRWTVRMEAPDAPAALATATMRQADAIGLTPAGLKENGWTIGEPAETPSASGSAPAPRRSSSKARLTVVRDDGDEAGA